MGFTGSVRDLLLKLLHKMEILLQQVIKHKEVNDVFFKSLIVNFIEMISVDLKIK
jgi:hypothetical protein